MRMVATVEASVHDEHKRRIVAARPISGTKAVFALLAYDPCVRRVYQPAPLPERRSV
jgi:hypothetical protein